MNRIGGSSADASPWYRDAIIYQLHVRAFSDGNDDGIGDFVGLRRRLDYLQELGVTALWLLPFYPSPLRDDGYDIADYRGVHPDYGTLEDFRAFLEEAHERDLRVITELVINHTSDRHPWFRRARRAPEGSPERDFYVWSDTPDRYPGVRIIFQDFESSNWAWDPVAEKYYWHRFYSHQPDLNFDNPAVREAVFEVMDHWLEMGVDGLRLDAVPYLYEREGTNCENLPETHAFLKELRRRVDEKFRGKMLLAEANQWPEDAVAYFGDGDECHMCFHFPIMPRLFMGIRMEDRFPILDILEQTPEIPEGCQWAVFLRNHDELTLEMVTDEERDYMYRVYAADERARVNLGIRRRLAPLLQNNRKKIELMHALLFSLPGTPVMYYGDEIGMGDNIYLGDRHGVRTPMQWSGDRNAGFSGANPQRLYLPVITDPEYRYEAVNVESQRDNPTSLLWWVRRLIGLRKRFGALGRGELVPVEADNAKVLAFLRRHEDEEEQVLAVFNLSRFVQPVNLRLPDARGKVLTEMFGGSRFPPPGEEPLFLTLGPHAFYWFSLRPAEAPEGEGREGGEPGAVLALPPGAEWTTLFEGAGKSRLTGLLPTYLRSRRWFAGKARGIRSTDVREAVPLDYPSPAEGAGSGVDGASPGPPTTDGTRRAYLTLVEVSYWEGEPHTYLLPLAHATGERAEALLEDLPAAVACRLVAGGEGRDDVLYDATYDPGFARRLLDLVGREATVQADGGGVAGWRTPRWMEVADGEGAEEGRDGSEPRLLGVEQSNTSVAFGERVILKVFRRLESGINPDVEVSRYLTDRGFRHTPPVLGGLDVRPARGEPLSMGILQGFVPNEGDAWAYTLDTLGRFFERAAASRAEIPTPGTTTRGLLELAVQQEVPDPVTERVGVYLESARLLGRRTGELHIELARGENRAFAPEPFSQLYQRSLYQTLRNSAGRSFRLLEREVDSLPARVRPEADRILELRGEILRRFRGITGERIRASRIRIHGDYHLGQVLYTGKDFVIIDFEGEPSRPLGERRLKQSPLRDVAGMIRSFHYAVHAALGRAEESGLFGGEEPGVLEAWGGYWYAWASGRFLSGYLESTDESAFRPEDPRHLEALLDAFLLEKATYELAYELNQRPDWVGIPARGLLALLEA